MTLQELWAKITGQEKSASVAVAESPQVQPEMILEIPAGGFSGDWWTKDLFSDPVMTSSARAPTNGLPIALMKGVPVRVFSRQSIAALSEEDHKVDCRNWNAVHVEVRVTGTTPSATLEIQGADETGNYLTLPDPQASKIITADTNYDVAVGTLFCKANLSSISGTFSSGQGFSVTITPFIASPLSALAQRSPSVVHRTGITAADVLTMGALTVTDSGSAEGNLTNVGHSVAVAARNAHGATVVTTGTVTPAANNSINIAFAAVSGAIDYQVFNSITTVASNPLWVGYITEAQRAAGAFRITAVGAATAGGSAPAGSVNVGIVGTGVASNANPYAYNNAWCPEDDGPNGTIAAINCTGRTTAIIHSTVTVNCLSDLPTLTLIAATLDRADGKYKMGASFIVPLLTDTGQGLEQPYELAVKGAPGLKILVAAITAPGSGQTASVSVDVDLV